MDIMQMVNPCLLSLKPYKPGKSITHAGQVKLASNENPLGPSQFSYAAINKTIENIRYYPSTQNTAIREALSQKYQLSHEHFMMGNGSDELIWLIVMAFANDKRAVLSQSPSFLTYKIASVAQNKPFYEVANTQKQQFNLAAFLETYHSNQIGIIFIANPNNPTGAWLSNNTLCCLLENINPNTIVVIDEAYYEYAKSHSSYPNSPSLLDKYPNLLILRTFSKAYGLAGLRIGYMLGNPEIIKLLMRIRAPFSINHLAQHAACAALQDTMHLNKTLALNQRGLNLIQKTLNKYSVEYIPTLGNFICFNAGGYAESWYKRLLAHDIIVRPLGAFGLPSHLRVSTGLDEENKYFCNTLEHIINNKD